MQWDARGSVVLGNLCVHVDGTLTDLTNLNTAGDHRLPFVAAVYPHCSKDNVFFHSVKIVQERFEEYDKELRALPWRLKFQELNPIKHLLVPLEAHT